jgi:hypothetical protein
MRNFKDLRKAAAIRRLPNAIKSLNLKAAIKNAPACDVSLALFVVR